MTTKPPEPEPFNAMTATREQWREYCEKNGFDALCLTGADLVPSPAPGTDALQLTHQQWIEHLGRLGFTQ